MADFWDSKPRRARWLVDLLDENDVEIGAVSFLGGDAKIAAFAALGGSASLELTSNDIEDINLFRDRVRIAYDPGWGDDYVWPVGTYLFDSPKEQRGIAPSVELPLLTKLAVVDQDAVEESYSLPEGSNIVQAVSDLILSTGESRIALTESSEVTSSTLVFEAGTPKLSIINALLNSANYASLWCDGSGQFRVEPYVEPRSRPIAREFATGELSIHKPNWAREQDVLSIPNRVVVVASGSNDAPPIVGRAENTDPDSPYSIPSRGRVISRNEQVEDMSSQAAADSYAQRLLAGGMTPVSKLSVTHAIVPLNPNDLVRFVTDEDRLATVSNMSFDLNYASQCVAEWREV